MWLPRAIWAIILAVVVMMAVPLVVDAFYIPGVQPKYYAEGETVPFMVNSLRSLKVLFPQRYYKLPFCAPKTLETKAEAIGEVIWGDYIQNSLYSVNMKENSTCTLLPDCDVEENNRNIRRKIRMMEKYIESGYRGFMNIDNLPVFGDGLPEYLVSCKGKLKDMQYSFYRGYALGVPRLCLGKTLINNHLDFVIEYNTAPGDSSKFMVVGLRATPHSIKYDDANSCNNTMKFRRGEMAFLTTDDVREGAKVYWTYSVAWQPSNVLWATRWDAYLHSSLADSSAAFHWLYVFSSLLIVFLCATAVAMVLMRALHKDFNRYNSPDQDDNQEDTGWKLVHADVFRTPYRAPLLAALAGNGFQVLAMFSGVLLFALLGFLSPARRGALLTAIILLFVFMSVVAGYMCGLLLKYFNRCEWKHVFFCGCAFPGTIVAVYTFANTINWAHGSTDTVPFSVLFTIFLLWLLISLPLTVLGASFSFRQEPLSNPVRVGRLAREIPPQAWANSPVFLYTIPPIFPLFAIILELNFVLQALWAGQVYYVFGFLALVFLLWVIITALVTVFHLYYVLCYENHQWWWISFILPGGLGVHVFVYSIYFYATQLAISSFASTLLYFMYMGLLSYAYGLSAGAIGLISGIFFLRKIYGSIKVD
ncbi:endosomal integral membrane protein [Trypanosoma rangeli]|uniref:Transmembrane 9 superfamily member n=1 Tax=Trypanosoma rangeli TaxID=5698 RepID=A0A422NED2_TRYRA|nr:endosomal integral membrane protein [Trypanosoma rangeli]RNF03841.1 endosomal integral membrane protein [Trypanosoma rangeli]|eukprot:RNF03841.1 endosomal integral membrane protein [Trypanosoma rangeli]